MCTLPALIRQTGSVRPEKIIEEAASNGASERERG